MGRYVINGGKTLSGEVTVNGGKNAVLPILAATLLNRDESIIHNCPWITDVSTMLEILICFGCKVKREGNVVIINSKEAEGRKIPKELVKKMRSSVIFLGSALSRFKEVSVSYPGGCEIGERPIDLHLISLFALGADITEVGEDVICRSKKLKGAEIAFPFPSVGATENAILAAVLAEGTTVLKNAAKEPEIFELARFLNKCGAKITGAGSGTIRIEGVLRLKAVEFTLCPDRIEAGTYLTAAAITGGNVYLRGTRHEDMTETLNVLEKTGCVIARGEDGIYLKGPNNILPVNIKTLPYPGFPTDMQPAVMSLLTLAKGTSIIIETVFEARFKHAEGLCKMGADIRVSGDTAVINGVKYLSGTELFAKDLRGGAAFILAGLAAEGETTVFNSQFVERGYESIESTLTAMGADIKLLSGG